MKAVVLFAHGSRDPLWRAPIEAVAQAVRQQSPGTAVACAYLELCPPDLPQACQALMNQGATTVRVLPVFFGMGKHAREDLPELMAALRQQHPGTHFELLPAAGEHPALTQLLAHMALGTLPPENPA
ncbi:MAG TPA: CbiX/SirB N-terminal domain-containing protein [Burkholderiaceae bacterium]|nr:CbiX/SirB N-terminal domain-containing protein [Burkholderiaceae bacterium]